MTKAKAQRIVELVGDHVRGEMLTRFRPDCCVATARVLSRVFEAVGINQEPMAVAIAIYNRRFVEQTDRGVEPPTDRDALREWCELTGAYSVGAAPGGVPNSRGFNGHVVVWLPDLAAIVDGSVGQMARPERGIVLPETIAWTLDRAARERFESGGRLAREVFGSLVIFNRIDDESFRRAPDWQDETRTDEIVRRLVRTAKGRG